MSFILLTILIFSSYQLSAKDPLSELAQKYRTDKGPGWHNYTPLYDNFFSKFRTKPIKFLEIGFWHGASARMWEQYFPKAELHFIDIDQKLFDEYGKNYSKRCHFHVINQSDPEQLEQFIKTAGVDFDIIIDDGGHSMEQQITSFKWLFPALKSGGTYVVEDLFSSYIKCYGNEYYGGLGTEENPQAGPGGTIYFLMDLIHELNYTGARTRKHDKSKCPADIWNHLSYYQKHIQSIQFHDIICFITKR